MARWSWLKAYLKVSEVRLGATLCSRFSADILLTLLQERETAVRVVNLFKYGSTWSKTVTEKLTAVVAESTTDFHSLQHRRSRSVCEGGSLRLWLSTFSSISRGRSAMLVPCLASHRQGAKIIGGGRPFLGIECHAP